MFVPVGWDSSESGTGGDSYLLIPETFSLYSLGVIPFWLLNMECSLGIKSGIEGYGQDGKIIILWIGEPADHFIHPVFVNK